MTHHFGAENALLSHSQSVPPISTSTASRVQSWGYEWRKVLGSSPPSKSTAASTSQSVWQRDLCAKGDGFHLVAESSASSRNDHQFHSNPNHDVKYNVFDIVKLKLADSGMLQNSANPLRDRNQMNIQMQHISISTQHSTQRAQRHRGHVRC